MVLDNFFGAIFGPLLQLPPLAGIVVISFLLSLLLTLVYKWVTDQTLMKALKDELKELQVEMRKLSKEPEKLMKVHKKAMDKNMKYMMHSMKPTLFTLLPILLIFAWLNGHMVYYPLVENQPFTITATFDEGVSGEAILIAPEGLTVSQAQQEIVDGTAVWEVTGKAHAQPYTFSIQHRGQNIVDGKLIITESKDDRQYIAPVQKFSDKIVSQIVISNERIVALNLFGWKLGWLGSYILFSIIFSMLLRKILKVY